MTKIEALYKGKVTLSWHCMFSELNYSKATSFINFSPQRILPHLSCSHQVSH